MVMTRDVTGVVSQGVKAATLRVACPEKAGSQFTVAVLPVPLTEPAAAGLNDQIYAVAPGAEVEYKEEGVPMHSELDPVMGVGDGGVRVMAIVDDITDVVSQGP